VTHTSLRPASPEAPDGPRRERRRWPWVAAATLAAIAIGSAAYAMVSDSSGTAHPAPTGSLRSASDGSFAFTVGAVRCGDHAVGPADLAQTANGQFCLVDVTVRNAGTEAALLDPGAQQAFDDQGHGYPESDRAAVFLNDGNPTLLEQIPPGASVPGVLPFEVPAGAKLTALELREAAGSAGVRVPLS
jgi:Domain of unknown function (DUF4352)